MHPATKRTWLQTGGLDVEPIHADLRDAFDTVAHVAYIGGACFRLLGPNGQQLGLVQFQGSMQSRVDHAIAETTERLATGAAKPVDLAAGDTLIRPLNMNDPVDRAMAENAISRPESNVIVPDIERQDPPPIDLPDYVRDDVEAVERRQANSRMRLVGYIALAFAALAVWGIIVGVSIWGVR